MNRLTHRFFEMLPVALVGFVLVVPAGKAQIVTLSDVNSEAHIDTTQNAGNGLTDWSVNGRNRLAQQWFWYRTDNGLQQSVDTISAPSISQPDAADMSVTYANATFSLAISYSMNGTAPGSGDADIVEVISIHNLTTSPLNFTFFKYSHFALDGNPLGDSVTIHPSAAGGYDQATETALAWEILEPLFTSPANRAEASTGPNTLNSLINTPGYNLNNVTGAGPGEVASAYQWNFTDGAAIPADGENVLRNKLVSFGLPIIPEPSVLALSLLGLAVFALRRRARRL